MLKRLLAPSLVLSVVAMSATPTRADEGLWPIESFPVGRLKAAYGVDISKAWLEHVSRASVRLGNGCSASVVSVDGLVLTNNHCVAECAQQLSGGGQDFYTNGFVADDPAREKKCSGLRGEVLISIADVTARIRASEAGLDGAALLAARANAIDGLQKTDCPADATVSCQVIASFGGARYALYRYRAFNDVRLAFSPGTSLSTFGNGETPGFALDVAFLRFYDNGRPASTPDHLQWNSSPPRKGELVFVMGSPQRSERELTTSQLRTKRSLSLPYEMLQDVELIGRLTRFGQESAQNKQFSDFKRFAYSNHYDYILDLFNALNDESFFGTKVAEEAALRAKAGPTKQAPWSVIDQAEQARRVQELPYDFVVTGPNSRLFSYARTLVRGAMERTKPSQQRLPEFTDTALPLRDAELANDAIVYLPLEQVVLESWLEAARRYTNAGDATATLLLDGSNPEELSVRLARSKLGDKGFRQQLWNGGMAAIRASDDPMIQFVLRIDPVARALRAKWERTVLGPESRAAQAIGELRLQAYGADAYPDANRSLRLSYGKIEGLVTAGNAVEPFSTIGQLYGSATGHEPYKLGDRWLAAKSRIDPATVLDMLTTNDGIDGNSGSPLLNARGEAIGAFWGGNDAALAGDFGYEPRQNRALAVSAAGVTAALTKVYGANSIAKELAAGRR